MDGPDRMSIHHIEATATTTQGMHGQSDAPGGAPQGPQHLAFHVHTSETVTKPKTLLLPANTSLVGTSSKSVLKGVGAS